MNMTGKNLNTYATLSIPTSIAQELNKILLGAKDTDQQTLELIKKELLQANGVALLTHQMDLTCSTEELRDSQTYSLLNVHCPLWLTTLVQVVDKETKEVTTGFDSAFGQKRAQNLCTALSYAADLWEMSVNCFDLPRPDLNFVHEPNESQEEALKWLEARLEDTPDGSMKKAYTAWKVCIYEDDESLTFVTCFIERRMGEALLMNTEHLMA